MIADDSDFRCLRLTGVPAHPHHIFGMVEVTAVLRRCFNGEKRDLIFPAQLLDDLDDGNTDVALSPGFMCLTSEDRGDVPIEGFPSTELMRVPAEPGGTLMGQA
jgi:hypothetical protein